MHLKRWLTGIIALPVLIYLVGFSPRWIFHGFLCAAAIVGLFEFLRMTVPAMPEALRTVSLAPVILLFWWASKGSYFLLLALFSLSVAIPIAYHLFMPGRDRADAIEEAARIVFGFSYVCLPLAMLVFIDRHPAGNVWIFFLLSVVFASDTGAFYFGRFFGKRRLHPSVSPGKTWEGAVGGMLCSLVPVYIFQAFFHAGKVSVFFLALTLAAVGQIGDLAESLLKRSCGVKDSGGILPGHGGVLDRIDGVLFAVPVLYVYLAWVAV
ncbi:MAG: phosphatidate cytidylyltransferase [Thermodesulfobacteriota bacterium]